MIFIRETRIGALINLSLLTFGTDPDLHLIVISGVPQFCLRDEVRIRHTDLDFFREESAGTAVVVVITHLAEPHFRAVRRTVCTSRYLRRRTAGKFNRTVGIVMVDDALIRPIQHLLTFLDVGYVNVVSGRCEIV